MKTIKNMPQGSPEWHQHRATSRNASEAPSVMNESPYTTRQELLRQKATGYSPDVDSHKQRLFDRGHKAEAEARLIVETAIGEELYPVVGTTDDGYLSASMDGLTMDGLTIFEHKLHQEKLAEAVRNCDLPPAYYWQLEQQLLVTGAERVLFVCSDGTEENWAQMEYRPVEGRAEKLIAAWKQFDEDVANYQHVEIAPAAVARPTLDLPMVSITTSGKIAIISNLKRFGTCLQEFIEALPKKPSTDQEFADCKAALTKLKKAEEMMDSEEAKALSQMESIDEMRREKKLYQDLARETRLALEKLVDAREKAIKAEIMQRGKDSLAEHIASLNKVLVRVQMPMISADFAAAIKSKRTIASLNDAVDSLLSQKKIEANEIANKIQINLATLDEQKEFNFLFNDIASLTMKANDDLQNVIKLRIAEHQAEQRKKLDAERERIRKEEQERAEKAAAEKARQAQAAAIVTQPAQAAEPVATTPSQAAYSPPSAYSSPSIVSDAGETAKVLIPSPAVITGARQSHNPNEQDTAWKIAVRVAEMDEHERCRVLQFCERLIEQRKVAA